MAVVGAFTHEEDFLAAAENLQSSGFDNISLLSPVPLEEAQQILGLGKSPVRVLPSVGIDDLSDFARNHTDRYEAVRMFLGATPNSSLELL